ncbi:MAG: nucleotide sugar dehydrogenase [Methanocellales archaeon]
MKIYKSSKGKIIDGLRRGKVTIAIYGLGKMGLPLAAVFADAGARVIGVDIDSKVVESVNRGECSFYEPGLAKLVRRNVQAKRLTATMDLISAAKESDVMIIIVPILIDGERNPDLTAVKKVCEAIARGLKKGDLVILESTAPPKTTEEVILPILESSGLKLGDFGLAHAPERTMSGTAIRDITRAYPKIVGGVDKASTKAAAYLYSAINKRGVIELSSARAAEAVKVFEGIYRDVNIALANELYGVCEELGISALEVFEAANTQPYCHLHKPGCGVGGHCIPVYPYFIIHTSKADTSLIKLARQINDSMPRVTVKLLESALASSNGKLEDSNILVLGLTFRGDAKETRYSPALEIIKLLRERGVNVYAFDPMLSRGEVELYAAYCSPSMAQDLDGIIIASDHTAFKNLDWGAIGKNMRRRIIVDGRQVVDPEELKRLGFMMRAIG